MIVEVIDGKPDNSRRNINKVVVAYDPEKELTTVDCDVDLVTLGIAATILNGYYEKHLSTLEPELAMHVKRVIKEVIDENAKH